MVRIMFEKCVECERLGSDCIPNLYVMPIDDMREFLRALKHSRGLTNADISAMSGVPKGTVGSFFSRGGTKDANYSTFAPVMASLMGSVSTEIPCAPAPGDTQDHAELIEQYKVHIAGMDSLLKWRKRVIIVLLTMVCVLTAVIITALIVDRLNGHIGFFWLEK